MISGKVDHMNTPNFSKLFINRSNQKDIIIELLFNVRKRFIFHEKIFYQHKKFRFTLLITK